MPITVQPNNTWYSNTISSDDIRLSSSDYLSNDNLINIIKNSKNPSKYLIYQGLIKDPMLTLRLLENIDFDLWQFACELLNGESLKYYKDKLTNKMVSYALEINPEFYKYVDRNLFPIEYAEARLKCI